MLAAEKTTSTSRLPPSRRFACRVSTRRVAPVTCSATRPLSGWGVSELAANMKPFSGCNSYFLLDKAINGDWDFVDRTLKTIKKYNFTVIRIWGFSDGDVMNSNRSIVRKGLQTKPGQLDALDTLRQLLDKIHGEGLQAMVCLTNCLPDYGGMYTYVRWAKQDWGPIPELTGSDEEKKKTNQDRRMEAFEFYTNETAKNYYKQYVNTIVTNFRNHPSIHSWDICNEPRNNPIDNPNRWSADDAKTRADALVNWINSAAGWVKSLDPTHPVTVGSEGFFGPSSTTGFLNYQHETFYDASTEGCDWLREGALSNLDFVCIHPYMDQWCSGRGDLKNSGQGALNSEWLWRNVEWIRRHSDACRDMLGNKPLVVQEFNMPDTGADPAANKPSAAEKRGQYYNEVKQFLLDENSPVIGSMVWMVAAEKNNSNYQFDAYTMAENSPPGIESGRSDLEKLKDMLPVAPSTQ